MDSGEQITGTRDEHYDLISVLYHALQGAENCNTYAVDAEAIGDTRLAAFFREAGVAQTRLAERAKTLLGILEVPPEPEVRPEGAVPSDVTPEDAPSDPAAVDQGVVLPPGPEVPAPEDLSSPPPGTALPDGDVELPLTGDQETAGSSQAETAQISPEDLDPTISALEGGAVQLPIEQAVAEVESWERRLEASGEPELQAIAGNLGALRALLSTDDIDTDAAGPLLTTLGQQVQEVSVSGGAGAPVAERLQRLGELLLDQGRSLSG